MAFNGLRLEYALKGNSNYIAWKDKMEAVLEDNDLKEFIDTMFLSPIRQMLHYLMHGKRN